MSTCSFGISLLKKKEIMRAIIFVLIISIFFGTYHCFKSENSISIDDIYDDSEGDSAVTSKYRDQKGDFLGSSTITCPETHVKIRDKCRKIRSKKSN